MHVFYVTDYWFPKIGGMERSIENLCRAFPRDLDLEILTPDRGDTEEPFIFPVIRFPVPGERCYYDDVFRYINSGPGEKIVHIFGFSFTWPEEQAELVRKLGEFPDIHIVCKSPTLGDVDKYLSTTHRIMKDSVDTYIALTEDINRELAGYGIEPSRIRVVPNSVSTTRFSPVSEEDKGRIRKEHDISPEVMLFGFFGRFILRKRLDLILSALGDIDLPDRPLLLLVGDSDPSFNTAYTIPEDAEKLIRYIPFTPDIAPLYGCLDCYVTASEAEGMSNALLEALSCGLPLIASDIPGHRELIDHGQNGLLFEAGSRRGLVERIQEMTISIREGDAPAWGLLSRQKAVEQYDSATIAGIYLKLYWELLGKA